MADDGTLKRGFNYYAVAGDRYMKGGNYLKATQAFTKAVRLGTDDAVLLVEVLGLVGCFVCVCFGASGGYNRTTPRRSWPGPTFP